MSLLKVEDQAKVASHSTGEMQEVSSYQVLLDSSKAQIPLLTLLARTYRMLIWEIKVILIKMVLLINLTLSIEASLLI